ncbi:hypothetical protein DBV05_g8407 [Lasiodiplodia theobromae]|uniref:Uncharacterized protein n=1 Tax=Lasiodiplodia theobromae TaxID=45133 RepID=A0A5N5D6A8_9PEZI|nr:hypothetical protein DBV05_g8407 [Lasiodiplodia theobromae]
MPIPDAINAVVSEQRLGLNIVQSLTQTREQQAAAIRLTLERLNEATFTQWIMLNVLVQGLPAAEQATGQPMLRLVSLDPRDIMGISKAQNAVIGMGPGHELLKRTVDTLYDLATSFHRNQENLRGLRQYDRYQHIPEPDPIEGPPDGVLAPGIVFQLEGSFRDRRQGLKRALDAYCTYMDGWMHKIMFEIANRDDDAVLRQLHKLAVGWRANTRNTHGEDCHRQVLEAPIDQSCWSDPTTDDASSILLGPFFKCSFVSRGFPDRELFNRLSGWEQMSIPNLGAVTMEACNTLERMHAEAEAHWYEPRSVVMSDIEKLRHRLTPDSRLRWLDALRERDIHTLNVIQRSLPDDDLPWPPNVHKRIFSLVSLHWASMSLRDLKMDTEMVKTTHERFTDYYLWTTKEVPRPISKFYGRAMHHSNLLRQRSLFKLYHRRAVQQFRDMIEQSCSNNRARKLMLAAMPASGRGTKLEQVRNIAVAAQLQQKSILDGATDLRLHEAEIVRLTSYIRSTEREHLNYLNSLSLKKAEELLTAYDANSPVSLGGETLPDTLLNNSFSRPYFHPPPSTAAAGSSSSSSPSPSDVVDLAGRLSHTSWRAPLRATIRLLRCAIGDSRPDNGRPPCASIAMANADVKRLTTLVLSGLFHTSAAAITTTTISLHRDRARALLARHAWTHGLHGAWLRWQRDAVALANRLRRALWEAGATVWGDKRDVLDVHRRRTSTRLLSLLMGKQPDWGKIECLVATCDLKLKGVLRRDVYVHARALRILREATGAVMRLSEEAVDAKMLPPDLREGERPSPLAMKVLARLHQLIRFEGQVLEGGKAVPRTAGWKGEHDRLVHEWRMAELCSAFRRLSLR